MRTISRTLRKLAPSVQASKLVSTLMLSAVVLTGCSHIYKGPPKDPDDLADYKAAQDPFEPMNRTMFDINLWVYHKALRPVGRAWEKYIPSVIRSSLKTLTETWHEPGTFFSAVGAGSPRRAGTSFMRFTINMTAGVAGFWDVAQYLGYKEKYTDPGMVMGLWGIKTGPYLFLPGIGPSSFRDATGYALYQALIPINYVPRGYGLLSFDYGYNIMGDFNMFAAAGTQLDQLEHESLDPYAFLRSAWQQNRQASIDELANDRGYTTPDWFEKPKLEAPEIPSVNPMNSPTSPML